MSATTTDFKISPLAYLVVPLVLLLSFMMMGVSVAGFGWTLIFPIALAWWIHHLRTEVDAQGMTAVGTFSTTRVPWGDVDGLRFPRWSAARAVLTDGTEVPLPSVGFGDLPVLAEISGGRVPDPFAAERETRLAAG
ncbi:PH domain-containing protein [Gordonia shandongensis]|uniref:PH domain-containing protein n=1 Tax=Gordonia shandongensis TaxID=376351 RepID=UPI00040859FF|nr:PH domain-containing protein [Gordonia shandongensis]